MKYTIALICLFLIGCATNDNKPVVVTVSEPPSEGGRFRTAERQRDVWISPQVVDNETLQHEQTVTFVEKPVEWRVPATIDPHTTSNPDLPLEKGDYDAGVVKRQQEIIADTQVKINKLSQQFEELKNQANSAIADKESKLVTVNQELQATQKQLNDANKRLEDVAAAEKAKQDADTKKKNLPWYKRWFSK